MSVASSKRITDLKIQVLERFRSEEGVKNFYQNLSKKAKFYHFVNEPILNKKQKSPNYPKLQYR